MDDREYKIREMLRLDFFILQKLTVCFKLLAIQPPERLSFYEHLISDALKTQNAEKMREAGLRLDNENFAILIGDSIQRIADFTTKQRDAQLFANVSAIIKEIVSAQKLIITISKGPLGVA
ncbi:MAG: hypothetical protein HYW78_00020 [Parcubacteria group bacterium]|nr:hypothetical protein [Parcubacteria group bacterium]